MAQMVEESPWSSQGESKRQQVREMFADIAPNYDVCNSLMSLSLHHRWRAYAVSLLHLQPGDRALDLCCGTGDFLPPLRKAVKQEGKVLGMDFCLPMLTKAPAKDPAATLSLGDACRLPLAERSFDAVTVGWGIRNVPDIDEAHREIARILKPGGRFVSVDMARPRNPVVRGIANFMSLKVLPFLGGLFGKRKAYTYLPESTQRFMSRDDLKASMERAGLTEVRYRDLFFGNICVHWGTKR